MTDLPALIHRERPDWFDRAACRDSHPSLFFVDVADTGTIAEAKRVCRACPVRAECLQMALDNHERHGLWGGYTVRERDRIRRGPRRTPSVTPCGTNAGFQDHWRFGEPPCEACAVAHAEAERARRLRMRAS